MFLQGQLVAEGSNVMMHTLSHNKINGTLDHNSALFGYPGMEMIVSNEIKFGINHATGGGLLDLLTCSSACYLCVTIAPAITLHVDNMRLVSEQMGAYCL